MNGDLYALQSLKCTCSALRDAIRTDLHFDHRELGRRVDLANHIVRDLPDDEIFENIDGLARMLTLLSPRQRERLVNHALSDPYRIKSGIKALSSQMAYLDSTQRGRLVEASIKSFQTWPPALLGAEMAYLDQPQRSALVAAAIGINDEECKAEVIGSLASGIVFLGPLERRKIIESTVSIRNEAGRAVAIRAIAAEQMAYLKTDERALLVEGTFEIEDGYSRAKALSGLGKGLKHLDDTQAPRVLEAITSITDESDAALALNGVCQSMSHLTNLERTEVLDFVTGLQDESERASALCNVEMGALDPSQRNRVIATVEQMDDEAKSVALVGLASKMEHLDGHQRERFMAAAISIYDRHRLADALAAAGMAAAHLSETQIDRLIDAATGIRDEYFKSEAMMGLSHGMPHFTAGQIERLIESTSLLGEDYRKAETVASLALQQTCMSQMQIDRLFSIANELDSEAARIEGMSNLLATPPKLPLEER